METDKYISENEPWKLEGEKLSEVLNRAVGSIKFIAHGLLPFLPETAQKIEKQFAGPKITAQPPLFPRL